MRSSTALVQSKVQSTHSTRIRVHWSKWHSLGNVMGGFWEHGPQGKRGPEQNEDVGRQTRRRPAQDLYRSSLGDRNRSASDLRRVEPQVTAAAAMYTKLRSACWKRVEYNLWRHHFCYGVQHLNVHSVAARARARSLCPISKIQNSCAIAAGDGTCSHHDVVIHMQPSSSPRAWRWVSANHS